MTQTIEQFERLGWVPFMLNVRRCNKTMLRGKIAKVETILRMMRYPYNRRIAGEHGRFTREDWLQWLSQAGIDHLAAGLTRLAQLNQSEVYLFWKKIQNTVNSLIEL